MTAIDSLPPPLALAAWIAEQEGLAPSAAQDRRGQLVERFAQMLAELAAAVCDRWPPDEAVRAAYAQRVWACFEQHWRRLAAAGRLGFDEMARRFESGDLGIHVGGANLLAEVMLAQSLELKQAKAATMFDTQYMSDVARIARRYGGPRAVESVENLAAELILPRDSARRGSLPPRIASYQGRTSLRSWLRAVVMHHCISGARKKSPTALPDQAVLADGRPAVPAGSDDCEELLRPIFNDAVRALAAEDRLMVKMLVLDDLPQQALAQSLGIHSGNVTRRRQRAIGQIMSHVAEAGRDCPARQQFQDCMDSVLAGDDRALHQTLGTVLADALRQGANPLARES